MTFCNVVKFNDARRIFKTFQRYMKNTATVIETATPCFGNGDSYA